MVFYQAVGARRLVRFEHLKIAVLGIWIVALAGCVAGYKAYSASGGGNEAATGEQHDTPYPAKDTLTMVRDVINGEGIPFSTQPDDKIETTWRPADKAAGLLASTIGVTPQYRYIIEVVPTGTRTSRIIANVETQDIPDQDLDLYLASRKLGLFTKFDQIAAKFPPSSPTPHAGGVNFALLPGETLKALAKRATGSESNWQQIAKDNGLTSSTDLSTISTVWVSNTLLAQKKSDAETR